MACIKVEHIQKAQNLSYGIATLTFRKSSEFLAFFRIFLFSRVWQGEEERKSSLSHIDYCVQLTFV